jgi:hypothetical protein
MKTIRNMKHQCPQNWETLLDEETEEFTPHSPPYKMDTCAPSIYIILNYVEDQE